MAASGVYQLTAGSSVIRLADGTWIPDDDRNSDWQVYRQWIAEGNTPDPAPTPSPAEVAEAQAAGLIGAGLQVTSTGSPLASATYALDDVTLGQIGSVARDAASGMGLPGGLSSFTYPDASGNPKTLSSALVQDLYKAMRNFVFAVDSQLAIALQGGSPSWPTGTATIP